jgi:hypothetical protein
MTDLNLTASDQPREPETVLAGALAGDADAALADTAKKIESLPAGVKLATNLDTYEKERPSDPFWFQHEGKYFHMVDPEDVDFQDIIIGQENPRLMLHVLIDAEQRDAFFSLRMPMGKMKKLINDYTRHFGLTDLGELGGSAQSFNGTRSR